MSVKINFPQLAPNLVHFGNLKDGDAFFSKDGVLGIKGFPMGKANAIAIGSGCTTMTVYNNSDLVEPCSIDINVTRSFPQDPEVKAANLAEMTLVILGHRAEAIKCYRDRLKCSAVEAHDRVMAFARTLPQRDRDERSEDSPAYSRENGVPPRALVDNEKYLMDEGEQIQAVKAYRERLGSSLMEAKDATDAYMDVSEKAREAKRQRSERW